MTTTPRPAAVITAFRPGPSLVAAVRSVLGQLDRVVVVDDGSPDAGTAAHDDLLLECSSLGATVVHHGTNRGIGAALNTGIREVRGADVDLTHVLTMDQDSELPPDFVTGLLAAERDAMASGVMVGMTSPGAVDTVRRQGTDRGRAFEPGGEPIQSGLLLPVATLEAVGEFDESLVIDGVDTDYWLRALDLGLAAVVAPGVSLSHRLGNPVVLPGGRQLPFVVASEFRYHYQWRNLLRLVRRHGRRHPGWAAGAVVRATRHLAIVTVLAPGRRGRLREAASGVRAGLRGETGSRRG
ncbi:glycosyltransferase [Nocardioides oleivorans]|uniref:Glycosyltransferase n=1 Tax=Nocardioides oleivorans TaxID=273676 RepID=A0A4Q2S4E2_9ACTN|nr:glycosyltransferase [Nocardioides oleivorans]RYB95249.1 glycosyltransferase [Nocardioides oleivorans]